MLCQQLINHPNEFAEAWNFGPINEDAQPVSTLADIMVKCWGEDAIWQIDAGTHPQEARFLKLDCSKAKTLLKWSPIWGLKRALDETIQWYKAWHKQNDMHDFTLRQIETYRQEHLIL